MAEAPKVRFERASFAVFEWHCAGCGEWFPQSSDRPIECPFCGCKELRSEDFKPSLQSE